MKTPTGILAIGFLSLATLASGQQKINLAAAFTDQQISAVNRTLSIYADDPEAVEMNADRGDGLGILDDISFQTGTIKVELLGENSPGRSFIGMAFNIEDKETFEAVYFRPFNFVAEEQIRKDHMLQYISHPDYTWSRLREERSGEFENEIPSAPDPDDWFKATIKVSEKTVEVYVNENAEAILKVERLASGKSDHIGLWVGNGSSGRFRNLQILTD